MFIFTTFCTGGVTPSPAIKFSAASSCMGSSAIIYEDVGSCVTTSSFWSSPLATSAYVGTSSINYEGVGSCVTTSFSCNSPSTTSVDNCVDVCYFVTNSF